MKKFIAVAAMLSAASSAYATTYVGTRSVGAFSATLSITTDDTLGLLSKDNIVDWTVTISGPSDLVTLEGPGGSENSKLLFFGNALSATATDLLFDFSLPAQAYLAFQNADLADRSLYCVQTYNCFDQNHGEEIISFGPQFTNFQRITQSGVQSIASTASAAVPEPAAWVLMIAGFGLVGGAVRRRTHFAFA